MKHTFKDAYGVLQQHAQTLREQTEPNIDDLLTIVTESVAAYKVCQTRIDAVEKALEKALGNADDGPSEPGELDAPGSGQVATGGPARRSTQARRAPDMDDDTDIPF